MKVSRARKLILEDTILRRSNNPLELTYLKINNAILHKRPNIYVSDFQVTPEIKDALEEDGYFVDTRYHTGFEIRWYEESKEVFNNILESNRMYAKMSTSSEVIEKYIKMQKI